METSEHMPHKIIHCTQILTVIVINCNSIRSQQKQCLFHSVIDTEKPDIIIASETHLNPTFKNSEVLPNGWDAYRKDRITDGGGVMIAHKQDMTVEEIELSNVNCELTLAKVKVVGHPTLTGIPH